MGRRANLQKSDGGRVPRPWRGTRSELGRIWPPPPLAGRGPPPPLAGRGPPPPLAGRGPPPPLAGRVRRRPPPLAGRVGAPHGANYDAPSRQGRGTPPSRVRLCERTYPPEGGERRSPKGIVRSHSQGPREGRSVPPPAGGRPVRAAN